MVWFLIRLILLVILFLLVKRLWISLSGAVSSEGGLPPRHDPSAQPMVRDPHCGLHLPAADALVVHNNSGILHFCSRECRDAYLAKQQQIRR